ARGRTCQRSEDSAKMPTVSNAHYPGYARATPTRPAHPAWRTAWLALAAGALLAGCGGNQVRSPTPSQAPAQQRSWPVVTPANPAAANAVTIRAIGLVGTPYRYGGNPPEGGFGCRSEERRVGHACRASD